MNSFFRALTASLVLSSCASFPPSSPEHPLSQKIADEVHQLLLQDPDSRSLYRVIQETESFLRATFPESTILVDVQLEHHKAARGVWYLRLQCTIDKKTYTFSLTAQKIQQDWEKITAKDIIKKLVWDMRETCRGYLQDRMSLFVSGDNKNIEQKLQLFLGEEKDVLGKHGLISNGRISISGGILTLSFHDTFYWDTFEYTFLTNEISNWCTSSDEWYQ